MSIALPDRFRDVEHLEEVMTAPTPELVAELARACRRHHHPRGRRQDRPDAGAARQARSAGQARRRRRALQRDRAARKASPRTASNASRPICSIASRSSALPKLPNVIFMAGRKFGSSGHEDLTWAMNAHVPALVAEVLRRLAHRRLLDRLRVPLCRRASRRRDRGDADDCRRPAPMPIPASRASRCSSISRARAARRAASSASTTRSTCATACCTTSRRA